MASTFPDILDACVDGSSSSMKVKEISKLAAAPETPPKKPPVQRVVTYVSLGELRFGTACTVKIMVCRKWESRDLNGKPLSMDYIVSDDQGGAIHCTAGAGVASRFDNSLEEGHCFSITGFTLRPNREKFRIRNTDRHCIHLERSTEVRRLECDVSTFDRHPFQLTPLEDIALNGSRFLVDVIGLVTRIGYVNPIRNNSQLLDIHIQNERGMQMRVTLWGSLCDDFLVRYAAVDTAYVLILPSTHVKEWRGELYLSSTSATSIQDGEDISAIQSFRALLRNAGNAALDPPVPPQAPAEGSLLQLLALGREQKANNTQESITLHCEVKIEGVRSTHGWYYFSCGLGKCKKGVSKVGEQFWCESCSRICEFPQTRYRLHLDISDESASLPVTVFDEIVEGLIKKKASKLMEEVGFDVAANMIPEEINSIRNTRHVLEFKTHTYFNHGDHESFTVSRLIRSFPTAKADEVDPCATSGNLKGPPTLDEKRSAATLKRKLSAIDEGE